MMDGLGLLAHRVLRVLRVIRALRGSQGLLGQPSQVLMVRMATTALQALLALRVLPVLRAQSVFQVSIEMVRMGTMVGRGLLAPVEQTVPLVPLVLLALSGLPVSSWSEKMVMMDGLGLQALLVLPVLSAPQAQPVQDSRGHPVSMATTE